MLKKNWKNILAESFTTAADLKRSGLKLENPSEIDKVIKNYPMLVNPYYLSLIKAAFDPVWKQVIPDVTEIEYTSGLEDPLAEDKLSPVENLVQRYPDRALFLVSNRCAVYCRFCTRKRRLGRGFAVTPKTISKGIEYIRCDSRIRDVLLSGGDPLLLEDEELFDIIASVRRISHVEIIRIGTRLPCVLPQRITGKLAATLKKFHPLYINTHFNHPDEITRESSLACSRLSNAGIPLGCQTVLLKGINDSASVMKKLMEKLLAIRVKPYYIHQCDLTRGTGHFRTPVKKGLEIIEGLRGHTSGLCVPHYVIDLPGGGGKVAFVPENLKAAGKGYVTIKNHLGREVKYPVSREDQEYMKKLLNSTKKLQS